MKTVHTDCPYRMQPLDWLAIFLGERDVSPNVPNRAARLQAAYHVAFRQVLVFQPYRRLDQHSSFFQHPQRLSRESKSDLVQPSLLLHDTNTLLVLKGNAVRESDNRGQPESSPCRNQPNTCKSVDLRSGWPGCRRCGRGQNPRKMDIVSHSSGQPSLPSPPGPESGILAARSPFLVLLRYQSSSVA